MTFKNRALEVQKRIENTHALIVALWSYFRLINVIIIDLIILLFSYRKSM